MMVEIRPESPGDRGAIRLVNRAAFDGDTEADLVDALRDGEFVEASLVAESDGEIVGHILFSRVSIVTDAGTVNAINLIEQNYSALVLWRLWDFSLERDDALASVTAIPTVLAT